MGLENLGEYTDSQVEKKSETTGRTNFAAIAESLNPDISKLEQNFSQHVKKVALIQQQMSRGEYTGKLTDLSEAEKERDVLKKQIEAHPDFGSRGQGFERNFSGRDYRIDKYN